MFIAIAVLAFLSATIFFISRQKESKTLKSLRYNLWQTTTREGYSTVKWAISISKKNPHLGAGECIRQAYWGQTNRPFN